MNEKEKTILQWKFYDNKSIFDYIDQPNIPIDYLQVQKENFVSSPLKIQGIKRKLIHFIYSNIDWDRKGTWIEPFMGSGVVGLNGFHKKARLSDTNPHIINLYNAIKEKKITSKSAGEFLRYHGDKLRDERERDKSPYYYEMRDRFNDNLDPLYFLFLNRCTYNGLIRFNKKGKFNSPFGKNPMRFTPSYISKIKNQIASVSKVICSYDYEFICCDWKTALDNLSKDDFVYFDPPYESLNNTYFGQWNEKDALTLAEISAKLECKFAISSWLRNSYRENDFVIANYSENPNVIIKEIEHHYYIGPKEENRNPVIEILIIKK